MSVPVRVCTRTSLLVCDRNSVLNKNCCSLSCLKKKKMIMDSIQLLMNFCMNSLLFQHAMVMTSRAITVYNNNYHSWSLDVPEPSVMVSPLSTVACQIAIDMQCFVIACIHNAKSGLICN